jgi:hypothetical protein
VVLVFVEVAMKNPLNDWYVASVPTPHTDKSYSRGLLDCMNWCRDTFGEIHLNNPLVGVGNGWRYIGEGVFEFKNEKDCVLFLLRWL